MLFQLDNYTAQNDIPEMKKMGSDFIKDYGQGYVLYINENLNFFELDEKTGILSEEYECQGERWKRIGSRDVAGAQILDGGKRFNTRHASDSIVLAFKIFDRTVFQEIFYRRGEQDFFKTVEWIKVNFPQVHTGWLNKSAQDDFKGLSVPTAIEFTDPDNEDQIRYLKIKRKYENFENPMLGNTFLGAMVKQCSALCAFTNQEIFILSNLEAFYGIISSALQCIPTDNNDIGKINLNGTTSSTIRMHVGETGDGKSDSFKVVFTRLPFKFENIRALLYTNDLGSAAATQIQIAKSPTIGFAQDEITAFFQEAVNENQLHSSTLRSLLKYYSPTDTGKIDLKEEAYGVVRNPHITVTGGTTFNFHSDFTNSKAGEAGYWRRVEVVIQDTQMLPKRMESYLGKAFLSELTEEHKLLDMWVKRAKYQLDVRAEMIKRRKLKTGYEYYEFLPGYAKSPIVLSQEAMNFLFDIGEEYRLCSEECGNELFKVKFRTCHDLIIRKAIVYAFTEKLPREWLIPTEEVIKWDQKVSELDNILLEESERERLALELGETRQAQEAGERVKINQGLLDQLKNSSPSKFPVMTIEAKHCEWAYGEVMKRFFVEMRTLYARSSKPTVTADKKISGKDLESLLNNIREAWDKLDSSAKKEGLELNSIGSFKMRLSRINKKIKNRLAQKEVVNLLAEILEIRMERGGTNGEKIVIVNFKK